MTNRKKFFTPDERKVFISESLTELRKLRGLAQKEVAEIIGVSQATYSAYERARNEPNTEILVRLSDLYGVSIDVIVQKDRTASTYADVGEQLDDLKAQVESLESMRGKIPNEMIDIMRDLGALIDEVGRVTNSMDKALADTQRAVDSVIESAVVIMPTEE